jgi:hypothetical protein
MRNNNLPGAIQDAARASDDPGPLPGNAKAATLLALNNERVLREQINEIRHLGRRAIDDAIEIGRRLVECKRIVGHGNWGGWLEHEFAWAESTALRFVHMYELAQTKPFNLVDLNLPASALYLIAAPSTPEAARQEILDRAAAGEPVSVSDAKKLIQRHRASPAADLVDAAHQDSAAADRNIGNCGGDQDEAGGELPAVAASESQIAPETKQATRRSLLQIWTDGDPAERELIRDVVKQEYLARTTGANLLTKFRPTGAPTCCASSSIA